MKANLPPSGTSRYQENPLEFGVPTIDERSEELPLFSGQGDPIPIKLQTAPTIDSSTIAFHATDDLGGPTVSTNRNGEVELESPKVELGNLAAGTTSDVGEATTTRPQERTVSNNQEQFGAFIGDYWYYMLAAVVLVGLVVSRAFAKRGPRFETAWEKTAWEDQPERANKIIGDKPRGQFKKTERFMRPVDKTPKKEEPPENVTPLVVSEVGKRDLADSEVLKNKSTKQQRVNKMPIDQPADDDFDFDLSEAGSDSDIFSLDEAAEINKPAHAAKSGESSKRLKTEEDVGASLEGEFEIDDDEFDDQDSQLSLADSDTEFGFDLDDEEPDSLLGSGKQDIETLAEDVESAGKGIGDLGLADVVDDAKGAVSGVAEGAKAGMADAATVAAGVAAAGVAAKGGFFSRIFGSKNKNKNKNSDDAMDGSLDENEVAPVEFSGAATDVADSSGLDDVVDINPMESLVGGDEGSDFDFDLEADDNDIGSVPAEAIESDVDEEIDLGLDEIDSDDSSEFSFDVEDSDEDDSVGDLATEIDEPVVEALPATEQETAQVDELAVGFESDSDEFSFDVEDSEEQVATSSMETLVDKPVVKASPVVEAKADPVEDEVGGSEDNDSSEFGVGLFDDEVSDKEPVEVASDNSDDDSSVTAPVVAATAAVGAGLAGVALAGIGLAGDGSVDSAESDRQWEAKLNVVEDQNAQLSAQVATLTKQLEEANKSDAQAEALQEKYDASTETVKSLGLEKDKLLKEKESADKENSRLTEELEAAEKQASTWEQEKADLLKQQEELKAEKEAANSELESLTSQVDHSASELSALQAEVEALQTKLADAEAKPAENGSSEDIEDLRDRFKRRLAAEHRKRKEAEHLVEEAEGQRDEVAKLFRAAKAELKELKS